MHCGLYAARPGVSVLFFPDHIPEPLAVIEVAELDRFDGYDVEVDRIRKFIKTLLF